MNLVKFLLFGTIVSTLFGELGRYPFGASGVAVSLVDIMVGLTILTFLVWVVETKMKVLYPQSFKYLVGFWIIGILSLVYSLTFFPINEVLKGSLYLIRFVLYSFLFLIIYNLKEYKILKLETLLQVFTDVGVTFAIIGIFQLIFFPDFEFLTDFGYDPHIGRLTSAFLDPNYAGLYLCLILGLIIYQLNSDKRIVMFVMGVITFISIILTYSRSAYLMLGIILLGFLLIYWNQITVKAKFVISIIGIISLILLTILFPRFLDRIQGGLRLDRSASERLESWSDGMEIFKSSPIIGAGFNNLRIAQENMNLFKPYSPEGGHSGSGVDSSILVVLSTTGILGLIIYLMFWWKSLNRKTEFNKTVLVLIIGLIIGSQFVNGLFFIPLMVIYFSLLGYKN